MHLLQINSFVIYNILLIIFFSLTANALSSYPIINIAFYGIFHFLLIYVGVYYYRKMLYFLYFVYGLFLDIFWINEIGPHLISFISILLFFNLIFKYLYNLNSLKIYMFLLLMQIMMIFFELLIAQILFDYYLDFDYFLKNILFSIILSYPIFIIFSKIDLIK